MNSSVSARFTRPFQSLPAALSVGIALLALAAASTPAAASARSSAPAVSGLSTRGTPHPTTGLSPGRVAHPNLPSSSPTCNDQFNVVPSANAANSGNNEFNSVSAISATDAWAVGDFDTTAMPPVAQPQAQHWDGTSWTLPTAQPSAVGTGDNRLLSVTAVATNNVWAVGFQKADNNAGTLRQVLIEHYDGTSWTAVTNTSANNPTGASNSLFGIKAFSATDIWAVGQSKTAAPASTALIEHYDGTGWTTKTPASTTATFSFLSDVLPLGATDVWAAGAQGSAVLIEHYNGTSWSQGPMPLPPTNVVEFLSDIAGVANDIWAVGGRSTSSTTDQTITMHYDGSGWKYVASPSPDLSANLIGVRWTAANDVWAVGASAYQLSSSTQPELDHSLIEHWDGNNWIQVLSPNPNNNQDLFDVAVAGTNLLLTVGFSQDLVAGAPSDTLAAALCVPTPTVTGLNPDHGNSAGGTTVTISGTSLQYPRAVKFGTTAATSFVANSDTQITAVAPAGAAGSVVDVTVTTMGGTSATSTADQYTNFGPGTWEFAGGILASGPAASTWGPGRLDAFVTGTDGVLWHRFLNAGTWSWDDPLVRDSNAEASSVSTASGSIDVFIDGVGNRLGHMMFSGGSWSDLSLGGVIVGAPAAVSIGGGAIDVFVEGADNHLWYYQTGASAGWHFAGGVLAAPPTAASASAGSADAFVKGTDGQLWQFDTVNGWSARGGKLVGKPAATARGTNLDVFVEGLDLGLWHWSNAGGTSSWELVGGKLAAAPAAASWGPSRLDVLVEGTDSALWHAWTNASGATGGWRWEGLGGKISGSPAAVTWGANRLDGFVRGTDNRLWHLPFD